MAQAGCMMRASASTVLRGGRAGGGSAGKASRVMSGRLGAGARGLRMARAWLATAARRRSRALPRCARHLVQHPARARTHPSERHRRTCSTSMPYVLPRILCVSA